LNAGAAFALAATFVFYPEAPFFVVILFSFMGAILGGVFVLSVGASKRGGYQPMRLILAGAAISALLTALSQGLALTYRLNQSINFWNAGGISSTTWQHLSISVPLVVIVTFILMLMRRQLTILSLGDAIAKGLGQNTTRISIIALLLTMLLAGISVAMVGQIAFVGLIIPHLVRFLVGTDYEKILPLSALFGGALVLIADIIARLLGEAPMSAIIAFIGVPFFLYLIKKGGRLV
ncbi:FecCD family ABC transporter permease, partial [Staphylococcus agnetis]